MNGQRTSTGFGSSKAAGSLQGQDEIARKEPSPTPGHELHTQSQAAVTVPEKPKCTAFWVLVRWTRSSARQPVGRKSKRVTGLEFRALKAGVTACADRRNIKLGTGAPNPKHTRQEGWEPVCCPFGKLLSGLEG